MIYFDNGATSYPKPKSVYDTVLKCIKSDCGNPGRSGHYLSQKAQEWVFKCRVEISKMINTEPENIIFSLNTTYALNAVIQPNINKTDHVIISDIEHNAVLRPVIATGCKYDIVDMNTDNIDRYIKDNTKAIICNYASNLLPTVNPIKKISNAAKKHSIPLIVDGAQAMGLFDIDMENDGIDIICAPSHKGLYGIQGCGIIAFSRTYINQNTPDAFIFGGTGINSKEKTMPDFMPERLEAGTLPTPAIAGLYQGIKKVNEIGTERIFNHEMNLFKRLKNNLSNMKSVDILFPDENSLPLLSFNISSVPSQDIATELDRNGICVRGGFHCSPLNHKKSGTEKYGAVRCSFSIFNTEKEIDYFTEALYKITKTLAL